MESSKMIRSLLFRSVGTFVGMYMELVEDPIEKDEFTSAFRIPHSPHIIQRPPIGVQL